MRWLDVIRLRLRAIVHRERLDAELDRELRAHLDAQIDEYVTRGMSPAEARRVTLANFGGVDHTREGARDARGVAFIENLARDVRVTFRGLRREPMLVVAATLSIALGAAGNIAVFSLARAVVFEPPTVRDPATLVTMQVSHGSHASYQRWRDLDAANAMDGIAGFSMEKEVNWLDRDAATSIVPMVVTANFFEVTGVPLARGRGFTSADSRVELDPRVAVVTHEFWQRGLGGDRDVIGRPLILNGAAYSIIGVLPPKARSVVGYGITPGVYVPLNRALVPELDSAKANVVQLIGRLKPGQTMREARAAIDATDRGLARLAGDTRYGGVQEFARVGTFATAKSMRVIGGFLALLGLVSLFVLLIACANVAGLLIARGTRRRQEIAIRLAIGGSRARLMQQLLIEGLWLALIGTAAGVGFSVALMRVVNSLSLPIPLPVALNLAPDRAVFVCALALVVMTVVLCALLPSLHATRLALVPALKHDEPFRAIKRLSARGVLLVGQVAVSTVLLVTAFLFVRNLSRTQLTNPGFEVSRALVAQIGFAPAPGAAEPLALLQAAVERVAALPGVEAAAYAGAIPLTMHGGSTSGLTARIAGGEPEHVEFASTTVGPGYFSTLRVRVLAGREFATTDGPNAPRVAIVNEEFVRRYFHGATPIGKRIQFDGRTGVFDIVGVVTNGKHRTLGEEQRAALYLPLQQNAGDLRLAFVVERTRDDPSIAVVPMRQAIGALDRAASVAVEPMASALAIAILPSRIGAAVLGTLGLLGLVLAAFGLYAIVSYNVSRRVSEIAIRSALGASRWAILRLVVRDAALQVGVGLTIGLAASALVTAPLSTFLVAGLSATDPVSFAGTAAVFLLVALLASWLPARHATRVSPAVAMRLE